MNNKNMDDYIKFFKDKPSKKNPETDKFINTYQQKSGLYISLANAVMKNDSTKCDSRQREYCEKLLGWKKEEAKEKLAQLLGLKENELTEVEPLVIKIEKEQAEPNQKWHLFVSWFGWKKSEGKEPRISSAPCPELWLWMFEASGLFSDDEINEIFTAAKEYREAQNRFNDARKKWNKVKNKYRIRLEEEMR
ncbi:MAG: hypothetical protein K6F84_07840 [Lachnospiraceae bacterium]|nr:hypothetical protein [Lachnospiraceae bacterium]